MRYILLCLLLLAGPNPLLAHRPPEFGAGPDELLYPGSTLFKLRVLAAFRLWWKELLEPPKPYRSRPQARGRYFYLSGWKAASAPRDMDRHILYRDFVAKYGKSSPEMLVVKERYQDAEGRLSSMIAVVDLDSDIGLRMDGRPGAYDSAGKGSWCYVEEPYPGGKDIRAIYVTTDFSTQPLPERYGYMLRYTDRLTDSSEALFRPGARPVVDAFPEPPVEDSATRRFLDYAHAATGAGYRAGYYRVTLLEAEVCTLRALRLRDPEFNRLLHAGMAEALGDGFPSAEFQAYAEVLVSPVAALELKRRCVLKGSCSRSQGPRAHVYAIAQLAGRASRLPVFLRAHLELLNDHFFRESDNSIAFEERGTYEGELDRQGIRSIDLLLGTLLRTEDPGAHRVQGNGYRIGEVLAYMPGEPFWTGRLAEMWGDPELDEYNRVLAGRVYRTIRKCLFYAEWKRGSR
ncbi:MAG: hypothetical protein EOO11_09240 [Chitinophagaceae bacterium]|nr:MAG: hypothetical protein EOO11_09240 [Chitinophagaceae bacterium]